MRCRCELLHEAVGTRFRALAKLEGQHELRMAFDPDEAPRITDVHIVASKGIFVAFFFSDEAPNFIGLHVANGNVLDFLGKQAFTALASSNEQLADGIAVNASDALRAANAIAFNEQLKCE